MKELQIKRYRAVWRIAVRPGETMPSVSPGFGFDMGWMDLEPGIHIVLPEVAGLKPQHISEKLTLTVEREHDPENRR